MFEHRHTLQTEVRNSRTPFGVDRLTFHRFVCSCGATTAWSRDLIKARRARDRHAFDGQLSDPSPIAS